MIAFPFTLSSMCDDMFVLNILARERSNHRVSKEAIYALKNKLIQYLYQHGYCVEAVQHVQNIECWNCRGEGCYRCDEGIYKQVYLIAFKFKVGKHYYKWHQPKDRLEFHFELTQPEIGEYKDPAIRRPDHRGELPMFLNLWSGLWLRGTRDLPRLNWQVRVFRDELRWIVRTPSLLEAIAELTQIRKCKECGHWFIARKFARKLYHMPEDFCSRECWNNWNPS